MSQPPYQVIARRWRPKSFQELVGQHHIITILSNAIQLNKIPHAFLFIGPRGTGKTTTARILSAAINQSPNPNIHIDQNQAVVQDIFNGQCIDVVEIDGASNNSVEQIRSLREECQYLPTVCKYKIYIIDEVHMLSQAAFNALLKTLEEPPVHVKFILATTEANKVPLTICSRCQRLEFQPVSEKDIANKLQHIAQVDHISIEHSAVDTIARLANGGMRDAQSILEQMISFGNNHITYEDVIQAYNLPTEHEILQLIDCIFTKNYQQVTHIARTLSKKNIPYLFDHIEHTLSKKLDKETENNNCACILQVLQVFFDAHAEIKDTTDATIALQVIIFKAIESLNIRKIDEVISLLKKKN